jgi:2-haloacid dehalogenase
MDRIILFDVNETLLDLSVLRPHFDRVFGDSSVIQEWFSLLLHSSTVSTLVDAYHDFGTLAASALQVVAARRGMDLAEDERGAILGTIRKLPAHPDVIPSLQRLRAAGFRLATLTNSAPAVVADQISFAGLSEFFEQLITVDEVRAYKPAPEPYHLAASKLGVGVEQVRLIAAHDWDVFGALRAGCRAGFIARGGRIYHPLFVEPDIMGPDLNKVTDQILELDL